MASDLSKRKEKLLLDAAEDIYKYSPNELENMKASIKIERILKQAKKKGPAFPDSLLGALKDEKENFKNEKGSSKKKKSKKMKRKKRKKSLKSKKR
tara:strand:+ start:130 stop:417 length:288 start_codon:yes stop_codon:yes gene_type:complete